MLALSHQDINVNTLLFINPKDIKLPPFNTFQYNPTSCVLSFYNLHLMDDIQ
ncbi:7837_t:CDS:2 [Rhizophagus irregularis]|nr:7837_t:CDS:2 [Rhizophagus irregularis]